MFMLKAHMITERRMFLVLIEFISDDLKLSGQLNLVWQVQTSVMNVKNLCFAFHVAPSCSD